jgi:hypothetical protein
MRSAHPIRIRVFDERVTRTVKCSFWAPCLLRLVSADDAIRQHLEATGNAVPLVLQERLPAES